MAEPQAGFELDARVATEVMGFVAVGYYGPQGPNTKHTEYDRFDTWPEAMERYREHWPNKDSWPGSAYLCHWQEGWGPLYVSDFSTDISAAWEIIEALRARGLTIDIDSDVVDDEWEASFWRKDSESEYGRVRVGVPAYSVSAPLAICRAALLAVGHPATAEAAP